MWNVVQLYNTPLLSLEAYQSKTQSELLHNSVEQILTNITTMLSKQTIERQERKMCTSVAAEEWHYRLPARTLAAWLTVHGKWRNWDNTRNLFFFEFIYVANLEFIKGEWGVLEEHGLIIRPNGVFCLFVYFYFYFLPNLIWQNLIFWVFSFLPN